MHNTRAPAFASGTVSISAAQTSTVPISANRSAFMRPRPSASAPPSSAAGAGLRASFGSQSQSREYSRISKSSFLADSFQCMRCTGSPGMYLRISPGCFASAGVGDFTAWFFSARAIRASSGPKNALRSAGTSGAANDNASTTRVPVLFSKKYRQAAISSQTAYPRQRFFIA